MSADPEIPRFLYHANAVGLSARFSRPFQETLDSQAVSGLSPSGGYSSARRENVRLREFLTCRLVRSETAGSYTPQHNSFDTFAAASVEGLNLADTIKADFITARVSSSHPATGDDEPSITPLGSGFRNLHVAGMDIELESFVNHFTQHSTMSGLRNAYKTDAVFRKAMDETMLRGTKEELPNPRLNKFFPWLHKEPTGELPEIRGTAILPLYRVLNATSPGFFVRGNVIDIQDFGRIHIGEIVVSQYERRITGLHVELGCPVDGSLDCSAVGGNGSSTNDPH